MKNKAGMPYVLLYDIEIVQCNLGDSWRTMGADHSFITAFGYRWEHEKKNHVIDLNTTNSLKDLDPFNNTADRKVVVAAHKIMSQADMTVGHYSCMDPEHKVLTANFIYKKVKDIQVGDELMAFEENIPGKSVRRRFQKTKVVHNEPVLRFKRKITLSDGKVLVSSTEHPYLVPTGSANGANWGWVKAEDLNVGDVLTRICPEWEADTSYEAGYIAASLDGEGHLSVGKGVRTGFSQKDNQMLDYFNVIKPEEVNWKHYINKASDVHTVKADGIFNVFYILGRYQPKRIMSKFIDLNTCLHVPKEGRTTIVAIEDIGLGTVQGLATESKTYITEGFPCHNTNFDWKYMNAKFDYYGLPPLTHIPKRDTCMKARSMYKLSSKRLGNLCNFLGIPTKESIDHKLWFTLYTGGTKAVNAMKKISKYCKGDVEALYGLYQKLKPHWPAYYHTGIMSGKSQYASCPECGSLDIIKRKPYVTAAGVAKYRMSCKACTRWFVLNRSALLKHAKKQAS